jgi:hypothetical protein
MAESALRSNHDPAPGRRCRHDGYYSGVGIYAHDSQRLRWVLVCDDCGTEMKEISALDYAPDPVFEAA